MTDGLLSHWISGISSDLALMLFGMTSKMPSDAMTVPCDCDCHTGHGNIWKL